MRISDWSSDVCSSDLSVKAGFDLAEAAIGPATILVNDAAANFPVPAEELSPTGWRAITQITLDGPFFCSTEFARRRIARGGGGAILNSGATYGWPGGPGPSPSAAAPAGGVNRVQSSPVARSAGRRLGKSG